MIKVIEKTTGKEIKVYNVHVKSGVITFDDGKAGEKFITKHAGYLVYNGENGDGKSIFSIADNFEMVTGKRGRKAKTNDDDAPKATTTAEPEPKNEPEPKPAKAKRTRKTRTAKADETPKADEPKEPTATEPNAEPITTANDDEANEQALLAALKNLRGGAVDMKKVREIVAEELAKLANTEPEKAAKLAKVAKANATKNETHCKDFDDIVNDVAEGFYVYLYGPAGSGKSHTAEQVARALGLDFYGQTTVQFAHDVRGYGDAGGNFQDTPFFKAFSFGGLYFQDEYDRSNAEAAIVMNTALANGWYDFPIVGRVKAHENFRFMAAGNTLMTGPDEAYVTGQILDPSSRDRFATYYEIGYLRAVEMSLCDNDKMLVDFVEDVRRAIDETGILHVVSYRATKYMHARKDSNKENVLRRCTFKGLGVDELRLIYGRLHDTQNDWARAFYNIL